MAAVNEILSQLGSAQDVTQIADRVGLPSDKVEQAISALGAAHGQQGDTVQQAADSTGIEPGKIQQVMQQIGGEGALSRVSSLLGQSGAGKLGEAASSFFGGSKDS